MKIRIENLVKFRAIVCITDNQTKWKLKLCQIMQLAVIPPFSILPCIEISTFQDHFWSVTMMGRRRLSNVTRTLVTGPASSDTTKVSRFVTISSNKSQLLLFSPLSTSCLCSNLFFPFPQKAASLDEVAPPKTRSSSNHIVSTAAYWCRLSFTLYLDNSSLNCSCGRCTTRSARRTATGRAPRSSATATSISATGPLPRPPSMLSSSHHYYGDFLPHCSLFLLPKSLQSSRCAGCWKLYSNAREWDLWLTFDCCNCDGGGFFDSSGLEGCWALLPKKLK